MAERKTVFITGASSGIGAACARQFSEQGMRLILMARREEKLRRVAATISAPVKLLVCDVRDRAAVARSMESLEPEWRSIDILVNNAGLSRGLNTLQDGVESDWEEMIDTNLKGLLYVTKEIVPGMIERGRGTIVNISSIAGRQVYPKGNVYCATKHAVCALSESMQLDLLGTGVRVTNIDPGMVETEFSIVRYHGDEDRAAQTYKGMNPLTADDVAETVVFCAMRPPHVSIHDVLIMPSDQASTQNVFRRGN